MLITSISGTHANNTPLDVMLGTSTGAQSVGCAGVADGTRGTTAQEQGTIGACLKREGTRR